MGCVRLTHIVESSTSIRAILPTSYYQYCIRCLFALWLGLFLLNDLFCRNIEMFHPNDGCMSTYWVSCSAAVAAAFSLTFDTMGRFDIGQKLGDCAA